MAANDESYELCVDGIIASAPPCAPCCESVFGKLCCGCCDAFAKVGIQKLSAQQYRAPIFLVLSFLSFIQIIFAIVACCGLSGNSETMMNVPWTTVELEGTIEGVKIEHDFYFSLTHVHLDAKSNDANETTFTWGEWCDVFLKMNDTSVGDAAFDDCQKCDESSAGFYTTVILTVVSKFGQFTTDLTRSNGNEDVPCQKVFGALVPIFGLITSCIALVEYGRNCYKSIPDSLYGLNVVAKHGIGFDFEIFVTVVGVIDIIFNILIPLPSKGDENYNYYSLNPDTSINRSSRNALAPI